MIRIPQEVFLHSKWKIRRFSEHKTRVWSLKFIQHLELGEDMVEECSDYGESFTMVQGY